MYWLAMEQANVWPFAVVTQLAGFVRDHKNQSHFFINVSLIQTKLIVLLLAKSIVPKCLLWLLVSI